jgi:hypothetical protein
MNSLSSFSFATQAGYFDLIFYGILKKKKKKKKKKSYIVQIRNIIRPLLLPSSFGE